MDTTRGEGAYSMDTYATADCSGDAAAGVDFTADGATCTWTTSHHPFTAATLRPFASGVTAETDLAFGFYSDAMCNTGVQATALGQYAYLNGASGSCFPLSGGSASMKLEYGGRLTEVAATMEVSLYLSSNDCGTAGGSAATGKITGTAGTCQELDAMGKAVAQASQYCPATAAPCYIYGFPAGALEGLPPTKAPTPLPANPICLASMHEYIDEAQMGEFQPLEMTRGDAFPTWWLQTYRARATAMMRDFFPGTIPVTYGDRTGNVDLAWDIEEEIEELPSLVGDAKGGELPIDLAVTYSAQLFITALPGFVLAVLLIVFVVPCTCLRACGETCGDGSYQCWWGACPSFGLCKLQDRGGRCTSESTNDLIPDTLLVVPLMCWCRVCEAHKDDEAKAILEAKEAREKLNPVGRGRARRHSHIDARADAEEEDDLKHMCFLPGCRLGHLRPDREWPWFPGWHAMANRYSLTSALPAPICSVFSKWVIFALIALVVGGLAACGVWGVVKVALLVEGVSGATQEIACVVDDTIYWMEQLLVPVWNISDLAALSITHGLAVVATAKGLGPDLKGIVTQMRGVGDGMLNDTCDMATLLAQSNPPATWPPTALDAMSRSVHAAASQIDDLAGPAVGSLDDTLIAVETQLGAANASLASAMAIAEKYTGELVSMLTTQGREKAKDVQMYIDIAQEYQEWSGYGVFSIVWGVAALMVIATLSLSSCTALYHCKERVVAEQDAYGDTDIAWSLTWLHFDHRKAHLYNCCQCLGIWFVHIATALVFILALISFILAGVMTPASVAVSDMCIVTDNFVNNVPHWMNSSGLLTAPLGIAAITSCMKRSSITKALKIDEKLSLINTLNFSAIIDMNVVDGLDFTQLDPMVTGVNAMDSTYFGYDVTEAQQILDTINSLVQTAACYTDGNAYSGADFTIAECTPDAYPIASSDSAHATCAPAADFPQMHDLAAPGDDGCLTSLTKARDGILAMEGAQICGNSVVLTMQADVAALDASTVALKAKIAVLKTQLLDVKASITPIVENIAKIIELGNCGFVRKRIDGVLRSICNPALEGMIKIDASFYITGLLLAILTALGQLSAERLRKFRPDLWMKVNDDDDDDDDDVIDVKKPPTARQQQRSTQRPVQRGKQSAVRGGTMPQRRRVEMTKTTRANRSMAL